MTREEMKKAAKAAAKRHHVSIAESVIRLQLVEIGEKLTDIGAQATPINVVLVGDLMARLALVYGRCVDAHNRGRL